MVVGLTLSSLAAALNSPIIGSINGEWKAWESELVDMAALFAQLLATAVTACSSPETTTDDGPFTAAMPTLSVSSGRTSSSVACTAIIAPGGQGLHEPAAGDYQHGCFSSESAGDVRCGQLAYRLAHHEFGPYTPGFQQSVQRDSDREQRRLREFSCVQEVFVMAPDDFAKWAQQVSVQFADNGVEGFGEHRIRGMQAHAHPEPLGTLPGEHEHGFARRGTCP